MTAIDRWLRNARRCHPCCYCGEKCMCGDMEEERNLLLDAVEAASKVVALDQPMGDVIASSIRLKAALEMLASKT